MNQGVLLSFHHNCRKQRSTLYILKSHVSTQSSMDVAMNKEEKLEIFKEAVSSPDLESTLAGRKFSPGL